MEYAICTVAVASVNREPSHNSEMINQICFGETAEVLHVNKNGWSKIKLIYDDYEGWCHSIQLKELSRAEAFATEIGLTMSAVGRLNGALASTLLPMGCSLSPLVCNPDRYEGEVMDGTCLDFNVDNFNKLLQSFLNTPYQWGGKTTFGIDCSGFTQTFFKFFGIALLRDASLQVSQGEVVNLLHEARLGDLAFFDNEEGEIIHVGILLNSEQIVHAHGCVKFDAIDSYGIKSSYGSERFHKLRIIKRLL